MTNINQPLIDLNNKLQNQFKAQEDSRTEQMAEIIDNYAHLIDMTWKSLARAGLCKNRFQFAKIMNLQSNFVYDIETKRLKPKLKDIVSIQMYINSLLSNLNNLLDEYANKEVVKNTLNRICERYTALYIQAQKIYLQ